MHIHKDKVNNKNRFLRMVTSIKDRCIIAFVYRGWEESMFYRWSGERHKCNENISLQWKAGMAIVSGLYHLGIPLHFSYYTHIPGTYLPEQLFIWNPTGQLVIIQQTVKVVYSSAQLSDHTRKQWVAGFQTLSNNIHQSAVENNMEL